MTSVTTSRRQGVNASQALKVPCKAATTANITLSGEQTIDTVAVVTGDRVLVKSQTSGVDNGIYEVDTSSWSRTLDFDGINDVVEGTLTKVNNGTQAGFWYVSTTGTITPGTTSIDFTRASSTLAVISAFVQTLLDDTTAAQFLTTLGISAFVQTLLDDADAATAQATLGISTVEVVFNQPGDYSRNGKIIGIPQLSWSAPTKLSNPSTLPVGVSVAKATAWSANGEFLSVAHTTTPFITIYQRMGSTFTKLTDPAGLVGGAGLSSSWSPNGEFLAVGTNGGNSLYIYQRTDDNTFALLSGNPTTAPAGQVQATAWSPNGEFLAAVHATSPFVTIYQRSGGTFAKLSDPATLPPNTGRGCTWSPDGRFLVVAHDSTPYVTIYERSAGTTFTKLADPSNLPTGNGQGADFSINGEFLAVAHSVTPYMTVYQRSGTTFTKIADPTTLPTNTGNGCSWSKSGSHLAVTMDSSPFLHVYSRSGTTLTKIADPASLPANAGYGVMWSPDGQFLALNIFSTPYITIYQTASDMNTTSGLYVQKQWRAGT